MTAILRSSPPRPVSQPALLVSADLDLRERVTRLAAAAGTELHVAARVEECLAAWPTAPVILIGADQAEAVEMARFRRRDGVHVLSAGQAAESLFTSALGIGAQTLAQLPASEPWLIELLSDLDDATRPPALTLAVTGGCGGAGATTLACALGQVTGRHGPSLTIDLNRYAAGVDRILGLDHERGARWESLQRTTGRVSARALRESVPRRAGAGALTWGQPTGDLSPFTIREAVTAARRGHDTVILDTPPAVLARDEDTWTGCDRVLVVVPAQATSVVSATRVVDALRDRLPLAVVVRRLGGPIGEEVLPSDIADRLELPLMGTIPHVRRLDAHIDAGLGPAHNGRNALTKASERLLEQVHPMLPIAAAS